MFKTSQEKLHNSSIKMSKFQLSSSSLVISSLGLLSITLALLLEAGAIRQASGLPTRQQLMTSSEKARRDAGPMMQSAANDAQRQQQQQFSSSSLEDFDGATNTNDYNNYQLKLSLPATGGGGGDANVLRLRRHAANLLQQAAMSSRLPEQQVDTLAQTNGQQLATEDEQTIRNQLPELIAQARNDKQLERALFKMLINASQRSSLANMAIGQSSSSSLASTSPLSALSSMASLTPQQQQQLLVNLDDANNWLDADGSIATATSGAGGDMRGLAPSQQRLARYEQQKPPAIEITAPISGLFSSSLVDSILTRGNTNGQYPTQGIFEKREYIKPCSFNAISCVRTPFRKS